jgi:hypothetical protein
MKIKKGRGSFGRLLLFLFCFNICDIFVLRKMKRMLALTDGDRQLLTHDLQTAVLGQLKIVDTRHHRREKIIWTLVWL